MFSILNQHLNENYLVFFICKNDDEFNAIRSWLHLCQIGHHLLTLEVDGKEIANIIAYVNLGSEKSSQLIDFILFWNNKHPQDYYLTLSTVGKFKKAIPVQTSSHMELDIKPFDNNSGNEIENYYSSVFPNIYFKGVGEKLVPKYGSMSSSVLCHKWENFYARHGQAAFEMWEEKRAKDTNDFEEMLASC